MATTNTTGLPAHITTRDMREVRLSLPDSLYEYHSGDSTPEVRIIIDLPTTTGRTRTRTITLPDYIVQDANNALQAGKGLGF